MFAYRTERYLETKVRKRMNDTLRTVTWERDALALNGLHESVLCSSCYPLIGLTRNLIFAGKVPFS